MQAIKVMIVDDNVTFLRAAAVVLSSLPRVEVSAIAESGLEAIAQALATQPDLILLDVNMPMMDGVQAAARMRAQGVNAKIVFVSLGGAPLALARVLGVKHDGFISKGEFSAQVHRVILQLFPQFAACDNGA